MENFLYNEEYFCSDLSDLMDHLEIEEEDIDNLPDGWNVECYECELQPIFSLSADWIIEKIDEERLTEDGEELEKVEKMLNEKIDFTAINQAIPKLYYPVNKITINKSDIIEYCKPKNNV